MTLRKILNDAVSDEAQGLERIGQAISIADLFTIGNAICGMLGAMYAAQGETNLALALILFGVLLDAADGIAARLWGGGPLGSFLDSLADVATFGIAPAMFVLNADLGYPFWILAAVAGFYLAAGMVRLARFEILKESRPKHYYSGMTTTGAAFTLIGFVYAGVAPWFIVLLTITLSVWMVSRIRTMKLTWWMRLIGVAGILPTVLAFFLPIPDLVARYCLILSMTLYTFGGPVYIFLRHGPTQLPTPPDQPPRT